MNQTGKVLQKAVPAKFKLAMMHFAQKFSCQEVKSIPVDGH